MTTENAATTDSPTLLIGIRAIACHLGVMPRQIQHHIVAGRIPSFRIGRRVCARPTTVDALIASIEREALDNLFEDVPPGGCLLYGYRALGKAFGMTKSQLQHHIARGRLPVFRLGKNLCARARTVDAYLAKLESDGMKGEPPAGA